MDYALGELELEVESTDTIEYIKIEMFKVYGNTLLNNIFTIDEMRYSDKAKLRNLINIY